MTVTVTVAPNTLHLLFYPFMFRQNSKANIILRCLHLAETTYKSRPLARKFTLLRQAGGTNTIYQPKFIAVSLASDVYIAIRGSVDFGDFTTVFNGLPVPFMSRHLVHEGAMRAARWILDECNDLICSCTGKIVFTGHSLGGSVASIAATILRYERGYKHVIAICFGTFPTMSKELSNETRSFITTFILNRDPISKWNPRNLKKMVTSVMPLNRTDSSSLISLTSIIREFAGTILGASHPNDSLSHQIKKSSSQMTRKLLRDLRTVDDDTNLFNPGMVYHIEISDDESQSQMQTTMKMNMFEEGGNLNSFYDVIKDVSDHWFTPYQRFIHHMMTTVHGSRLSENS